MTHDELVAYHRGDAVERSCAWDNGAIVARQQGITSADEAIAAAVRDHQATVPHQAARRGRGIPDGAPAPAIPGTLARHDPWPALCIAPGLHRCSAAEFR
jgi:hypothetical protein